MQKSSSGDIATPFSQNHASSTQMNHEVDIARKGLVRTKRRGFDTIPVMKKKKEIYNKVAHLTSTSPQDH